MRRRYSQSKLVARAGKSTSTFYIVKLSPQTRSSTTMAAVIASLRSQYRSNLDKPQQPSIAQDLLCRRVCRVWRPHYYKAVKTALWCDEMSIFLSCATSLCFYRRRIVVVHIKVNPVCIFQLNISLRDKYTPIWHCHCLRQLIRPSVHDNVSRRWRCTLLFLS